MFENARKREGACVSVFSAMSDVNECLVDDKKLGFPLLLNCPGAREYTSPPLVKQNSEQTIKKQKH